jgi:Acyl-CoA dehydrogenases
MGHYISNLRDIEFTLFDVFDLSDRLERGPFAEVDADTARVVLEEVDRLARGPLAESFDDADRNPPVYDPAARTVTLPESFRRSYEALMEGEWWRLDVPPALGGMGAPPSLRWAASELLLGSNPAAFFYMAGPNFAGLLHALGTPDQQRLAELIVENGWGATMVLTEPDAGTDVGAGRTTAHDNGDGT